MRQRIGGDRRHAQLGLDGVGEQRAGGAAPRQDQPGEGLGLAFVKNSVRRLGGSIDVDSEFGKGSTFTLKFPRRLIVMERGEGL